MADIKLNIGNDSSIKPLLTDLSKALDYANKIKTALGDTVILKDPAKMAKQINDLEKLRGAIEKKKKAEQEELGILGALEKKTRELRSAMKSATSVEDIKKINNELANTKAKMVDAKGATNTWGKALDSFQYKFNALGNIAGDALNTMISGAKQFLMESIKMAAQVEGVRTAFNRLNKPTLLDDLRKATRGTVTDLQLMQSAVKAKNFKIPLEQLATYFTFATNRAIETGESVDYLVESIINGIGRKSSLVLDNLGISATELQEEMKKTGDFGAAAGNIIAREIGKAGDIAGTSTTSFEQFNTTLENLKVTIGESLMPSVEGATESLTTMLGVLKPFIKVNGDVNMLNGLFKYNKVVIDAASDAYESLFGEQEKIIENNSDDKLTNAIIPVTPEDLDKRKKLIENWYAEIDAANAKFIEDQKKREEQSFQARLDMIGEADAADKEWEDAELERIIANNQAKLDADKEFTQQLEANHKEMADNIGTAEVKKTKLTEDEKQKITQASLDVVSNGLNSLATLFEANKQRELSAAGDNAAKREAIERKYLKKQQSLAIGQALMDAAGGSVKTFKDLGFPLAIPFIIAGAAFAGVQIAAIKAQKFAEGGEVGGKPHSQGGTHIEAEKGEYVINKRSVDKYKDLIEAVNSDDKSKIFSALNMELNHKQMGFRKANSIDYTKKLYELHAGQEVYGETNEYFIIQKGNTKMLIPKK